MKFIFFKILVAVTLISIHKADIPVHCLKSQIVGKWIFQATEPKERNIQELYDLKCGHEMPSHEKSSHLSLSYTSIENFDRSFEVEFTVDAVISNEKVLKYFLKFRQVLGQ
jgi:cathepsin C